VRKLFVLLLAGCLTFACWATDNNPAAAPKYEEWIEQLGDSDYQKRDVALQLLQAQGSAALPALRKAVNHRDAEVRRRVVDLIPTLEVAAIVAPKRVSLKVTNKNLREVFDEVAKQTGLKVEFWSNNLQQTYSFELRNLTFWEAVDRISRETGMVIQQSFGDDKVRLNPHNGHAAHVTYDGAFRYSANNIHQSRSLDLTTVNHDVGPARRQDNLSFSFTIFVEPRLAILGLGDVKLTAAYDNEKNSLLPPANPDFDGVNVAFGMRRWSTGRYGGNRSTSYQANLNLLRVSEKATTIKLLRGTVPINLLTEQKPVVLAEKITNGKGKKTTIDTTTIHIVDVTEQPNKQLQVKLSISEDNKDNNDYTWMNTMYQRIQLFDDKGNLYQNFGTNWSNHAPNHVDLTFTYGLPPNVMNPTPGKMVFMSWHTLQHQVSFEFKDIPLP
jgi:hypothetical protein